MVLEQTQSLKNMTIGFIGLGLMGKPMARGLQKAGASLVIHNRSKGVLDELASEGMHVVPSPAAVAEVANIIILMLPDTSSVEMVANGNNGILSRIRPKTLLIDMGTTALNGTKKLAKEIIAKNSYYVDAPVSGGTIGAENNQLVIMAGGSASSIARAHPIFTVLGKKITHMGEVGAGQVAKAVNQMIVGLNIGAIAEALSLAQAAGVNPALVCEALQGGFADSRVLEVHGKRMIQRDFSPGGKCITQRKDFQQALDLAKQVDIDLPATRLGCELYDRIIEEGYGGLDHSALIKVIYPNWSNMPQEKEN